MVAESHNLNHIAGMGIGKSLEFLVKDFAVKLHPDKEEEIKGKLLGRCIQEYIDDTKVKIVAEKATWLRNDETHYVRKWEDKDVQDLKNLIRVTVNFIESYLLAKKYKDEMS